MGLSCWWKRFWGVSDELQAAFKAQHESSVAFYARASPVDVEEARRALSRSVSAAAKATGND